MLNCMISVELYDICWIVWYLLNCMISIELYDICWIVWYLLNCMISVNCMIYVELYDICWIVWYLLNIIICFHLSDLNVLYFNILFQSVSEMWQYLSHNKWQTSLDEGGGPRIVVSITAFHARVWGLVPGLGGLQETKTFLPHLRVKLSIVGSLRDREVACSASDRQGSISNPVSGGQCHLIHLTILRRFSWPSLAYYMHKGGLKPDSFHFIRRGCQRLNI